MINNCEHIQPCFVIKYHKSYTKYRDWIYHLLQGMPMIYYVRVIIMRVPGRHVRIYKANVTRKCNQKMISEISGCNQNLYIKIYQSSSIGIHKSSAGTLVTLRYKNNKIIPGSAVLCSLISSLILKETSLDQVTRRTLNFSPGNSSDHFPRQFSQANNRKAVIWWNLTIRYLRDRFLVER